MKQVLFLFASSAVVLMGADLAGVHTVYLLPMGSSLDQYLAERLTSEHVFQVVTDPKRADAVFTDRIGTAFEERLADLLAPPPAEKPAPGAAPFNAAAGPATGAGQTNNATPNQTPRSGLDVFAEEPANKLSNPAAYSSFGRGKGTIFLVDVKSKQVIWSIYERPKSSESSQLDRSASDIVNRLRRDLKNPEGAKP
jgi:hypothetical protein